MALTDWVKIGLGAGGGALSNLGGKSTTSPVLSPELQPLQDALVAQIMARMANPAAGTEDLSLGLKNRVNQRYSTAPQRITTQLAKRGFAASGQTGQAFKGLELSRMAELGDIDTQIASLILSREQSNMDLASRLLAAGRGQTTNVSGQPLAGAASGALQTWSYLDTLKKLEKAAGLGGAGATTAATLSPAAASSIAAVPTALEAAPGLGMTAGGAGSLGLVPGAGGATAGSGAGAGTATGTGLASSLAGVGLVASVPILAKGVNAFGDWLASKFPESMYGYTPYGSWDDYVYYLSNKPGGETPTEEGYLQWVAAGSPSWLG